MLSKKVDTHIAQQQNKNAESNGTSVSTSNNIPHKSDNVNNITMQKDDKNPSGIKYAIDDDYGMFDDLFEGETTDRLFVRKRLKDSLFALKAI